MSPEERDRYTDLRLAAGFGQFVSSKTGSQAAKLGGFQVLEQRLARRQRRVRTAGAALVGAGLLAAGIGGSQWSTHIAERADVPLTYRVGAGAEAGAGAAAEAAIVPPGTLLGSATAAARTEISFSDGTHLRMEPASRGRVLDLNQNGGRVALYNGKARVDVRHKPNARWFFEAGPFEVRVHGTAFSMAWSPASARFDLSMESGVVSVAGPVANGEVTVRAGETLSVTVGGAEASAVGPAPGDAGPGVRPPAAAPPRTLEHRASPQPEAQRPRASHDWRARLAEGRARDVVADAERRGLPAVLGGVGSEDLAALADAARYIGNGELARRALLAQRRRFAGASRAAEASFLLGRLEEESPRGGDGAVTWYDRYLGEAPTGAYVAEALGRKMIVLERTGRRQAAAAIAADYLRRFPGGSYAHAARVLVRGVGEAPAPARPDP